MCVVFILVPAAEIALADFVMYSWNYIVIFYVMSNTFLNEKILLMINVQVLRFMCYLRSRLAFQG